MARRRRMISGSLCDVLQLLDDHESVYLDRRNRGQLEWDDKVLERAILALVGLFVADSSKLLAFQQLVPQVSDAPPLPSLAFPGTAAL